MVGRDDPIAPQLPADFCQITELWLFQGTKEQKTFKAEFVGIKTREELIRDYGYPGDGVFNAETQRRREGGACLSRPHGDPGLSHAKSAKSAKGGARLSRPHGTRYALFKTTPLYRHGGDLPGEADRVIVRTADFAKRSPAIAKQLKANVRNFELSEATRTLRFEEFSSFPTTLKFVRIHRGVSTKREGGAGSGFPYENKGTADNQEARRADAGQGGRPRRPRGNV